MTPTIILIWLVSGISADLLAVYVAYLHSKRNYPSLKITFLEEWRDAPWYCHLSLVVFPFGALIVVGMSGDD